MLMRLVNTVRFRAPLTEHGLQSFNRTVQRRKRGGGLPHLTSPRLRRHKPIVEALA